MNKKIAIFLILIISSCELTTAIWKHGYEDRIKNFFVSSDGQYIAFIGKKYHYVLTDNSDLLKDILSWKRRGLLMIDIKKTNLRIDHTGNINGEVFIEAGKNIATQDWAFLQGIGFKEDGAKGIYFLKIKVSGKRYLPNNNDLSGVDLPSLSVPYKIFIHEYPSAAEKVGMVALTPITMTLDGVILIGKVVLMPFSGN